jgi:hypothetical protein
MRVSKRKGKQRCRKAMPMPTYIGRRATTARQEEFPDAAVKEQPLVHDAPALGVIATSK